MLEGELSDPRIAPSYVTDVVLAPGGKSARVFVAVHGDEAEEDATLEGLMTARAYIRSQLRDRMGVRHVPDLTFAIDRSEKMTGRMDELLTRMRKRERRNGISSSSREPVRLTNDPERHSISNRFSGSSVPPRAFSSAPMPAPMAMPSAPSWRSLTILEQLGCEVDIVLADPVPLIYRSLPGVERIRSNLATAPPPLPCILLECDSIDRTGLVGLDRRDPDQHRPPRLAAAPLAHGIGSIPTACAVGAMVYQIAVAAGAEITPAIATCLYTAILSDTGAFTYDGTNAGTFALAHDLAISGAIPARSPATSTSPARKARSDSSARHSPV